VKNIVTDKIEILIDIISDDKQPFAAVNGFEKSVFLNGELILKEYSSVKHFKGGDILPEILNLVRGKINS